MEMMKNEWKKLAGNKLLLISFVVIMFIPILYAGFFLKSVWDPYGKTGELPVAVVNLDESVDYQGKTLDVGDQLVENLKKNDLLDWHFVSEKAAKEGIKDRKYYMVVTLPKNFSKNASTLLDKEPKKMNITYETNGSLNYIGEVIGETAAKQLKSEVSANVTKAYAESIFGQIEKVGDGFTQAADGSKKLDDGTKQLNDGIGQLASNVGPLQTGVGQLNDGSQTLANGVGAYTAGVGQLADGSNQLVAKNEELNSGVTALNGGLNDLNSKVQALPEQSQQLADVANQIKAVTATVDESVQKLSQGATGLVAGANALNEKLPADDQIQKLSGALDPAAFNSMPAEQQAQVLAQAAAMVNGYTDIKDGVSQKLIPGATQISGGLNQLGQNTPTLADGAASLANGTTQLNAVAPTLQAGVGQLAEGGNKVSAGVKLYTDSVAQLQAGASQLTANSSALNSGANALNGGIGQISGKLPDLISGVTQLNDGSSQLKDGTKELSSKLKDGAKEVNGITATDKTFDMLASPDKLTHKEYSHVENYGAALAPYVLSLALYVGALVFNFIFPIRKISMTGQSSFSWWLSKFSIGLVAAVAMAVVEAGLILALGLHVESVAQFMTMAIVTSIAYMFLIMTLAMTFDNPGRFIGMVLLIVQLGGAGGTFPIPLTNNFFKAIHPYLPMSHSIYGFREAISGGLGQGVFVSSALILLAIFVVFSGLLFLSMNWLQKRHLDDVSQLDDNQKLQALED